MKFVSLISSGIDSPVATYILSKRADELIFVHSDNRPFTDDREIDNFINLVKHLKTQIKIPIQIYIVPHGEALSLYKINSVGRFTCVFCKRMFLRYAEKIAQKNRADAIIMGDSLGQVASQTLQNINIIEQAVKIPVLRPLIGFDKNDIIKIAKKIGSYDYSIMKSGGCTAVPDKPATHTKLSQILFEENKINIEDLVNNAINKAKIINL